MKNNYQIGDWVECGINSAGRVTEMGFYLMCVRLSNGDLIIEADEVKPIPLTAEILEKNFEPFVFEGQTYYDYNTDFEDLSISEYNEGLWEVKIDEIEFSGMPTWKMYVCDVHQLQQALRLANIDIDIKI